MTQTQQLVSLPLISPDTDMVHIEREIARMQAMNRTSLVAKQVDDAALLA